MLTTIGRFSHPLEAQIARARLEAAGIPAFVADEHTINMQWLYSNALGGVRLQVPMVCREDAVALLATDESEALRAEQGSSEFQCLRCGSDQVAWKVDGRRLGSCCSTYRCGRSGVGWCARSAVSAAKYRCL